MNQCQKTFWEEWFGTEDDVQPLVLRLGFFESADDKDRHIRVCLAKVSDELGPVHSGHDVIGDDQTDFGWELGRGNLLKRPGGTERYKYKQAIAPEDRLPCRRLNGIIIHQKNCACHVTYQASLVKRCNEHGPPIRRSACKGGRTE